MEKKSPFMSALNELMGNQPIGEEQAAPQGAPQAAPQPDPDPIPQVEARDKDTGVPVAVSQVAPTIINEDVTIDGSLSCGHDMLFSGSIKGNVKCDGKLTVRGYIFGNVVAAQVELCGARIRGNTVCNGFMTMDEGSMIVGDVESENLILGGKIKGDVTVRGQADVRSSAYLLGDLEVGALAIQQGACLNGRISTHTDESAGQIFSDLE